LTSGRTDANLCKIVRTHTFREFNVSLSPAPVETEGTALRSGRLGVVGIVFYVIAAASPLVGMTGALPVAIVLGNGAAVPGAYLAVGAVLISFVWPQPMWFVLIGAVLFIPESLFGYKLANHAI
jgi:hypothetical protein